MMQISRRTPHPRGNHGARGKSGFVGKRTLLEAFHGAVTSGPGGSCLHVGKLLKWALPEGSRARLICSTRL